MPELRELVDFYIKKRGRYYPVYYFDNGGEAEPDSLVSALGSISWQNLYSIEGEEYSNGVWNDNGTDGFNTSLGSGTAPTEVSSWQNGKPSLLFDGSSSLLVALAAANHDLYATKQTIFLVGQYDQAGATAEEFLSNGTINSNNFVLAKNSGDTFPDSNQASNFEVFYKNQDFNGVPFLFIVHSIPNSGNRQLKFLDNGITVRTTFIARDSGESNTLIGNNLNGNVASLGVSASELTNLELKKIISEVNSYYGLQNANDKHITFFGDSLTAGNGLQGNQTWPYKLLTSLKTNNPSINYRYVNDAISGIFFSGYSYWDTDVFAFSNVYTVNNRVAFIWLGTNDILNSNVDSVTLLATMENFVTDRLRAGFKKIIILTIISSTGIDGNPTKLAVKNAYNSGVKAFDFTSLEAAYDADIQVCDIDTQTELQDPSNATYYQVDQLHLTNAGMQVVADYVESFYITADGVSVGSDTDSPIIDAFDLQVNNDYVDVSFSKGLFRDVSGFEPIQTTDFELSNIVPGDLTISISSIQTIGSIVPVGSDKRLRFNLNITGIPDGSETLEIVSNRILFDVFGNAMPAGTSTGTITLNAGTPARDFGNALRYDGNNDAADWNGTVFSSPNAYSIVAWMDIDNTYPNNYSGVADGLININTITGGSTTNWVSFLFLQEGIDAVNDNQFVFGATATNGQSFAAAVQIPVGWEGRIMVVGRVRRKEDAGSGGNNTVNLVVKGLGQNGSADIDDVGTITVSSALTLNNQISRIQTGKSNGQSFKGDFIELNMVNQFLSNSEINDLWNNGAGSSDIDSLPKTFQYLFDETSGTNCAEEISSRDLTQVNFTGVDADKWVTPLYS